MRWRRWRWRARSDCRWHRCCTRLREYAGEPHRVELVASLAGVEYYDDSKGTNVGATVAALDGLGAEGRRLVAILGGDGKGQDFAPLVEPVARHVRAAVLIGRDGAAIRAVLAAAAPAVELIEAEHAAGGRAVCRGRGAERRCGDPFAGLRQPRHVP